MATRSYTREVIKNSFLNLAMAFIDKVGALVFSIIIARFLMPEGFGIYSLTLAVAFIFLTFSDLGMNSALIIYFSEFLGKNKKDYAAAYFRFILKTKFIFTLVVSLMLIFLSYPIANMIFKQPRLFLPLFISGFYIFILSFEGFFSSLFYSINKVKLMPLKETLSQFLRIALSLPVFFLLASTYYVSGIILGLSLTSLVVILFVLYYLKKFVPFIFQPTKKVKIDKMRVLKFLSYLSLLSASAVFFSYVDMIILGIFIPDAKYVGYYSAAAKIVFSIAGIFSFASILLPVFAQFKKARLKDAFDRVIRYALILIVPASLGLAVLGRYFIKIIFGYEYLPAAYPLYALALLIVPGILIGLFMTILSAKEKIKKLAILFLFINVINIILNFIFIKIALKHSLIMATVGASIATVLSWYIYLVGAIIIMKKALDIDFKLAHLIKPLVASVIMAIVLFFTSNLVHDMTLIKGIAIILLGIVVYLAVLVLLKGTSKKDVMELNIFH